MVPHCHSRAISMPMPQVIRNAAKTRPVSTKPDRATQGRD